VKLRSDREAAGLVLDRESVPGLDLDRGGALPAHLVHVARDLGPEVVVGRCPRRRDRGADAAGCVRLARHARGELLGAVAGEHQVAVAVDEAGDDGPSCGVDGSVGRRGA
jgi:hypothetical protein